MFKKREKIIIICLIISLFSFFNVNSYSSIGSANVRYDSKIIDEFNNLENNPLNETFVPIYFTLRDFSEARDLLATLNESKIKNIAIRDSSKKIGLDLTKEEFDKLINDPRIETIYYDAPMYLSLDKSAPLINATYVWNNFNYTGKGIKVCIIDTGIDEDHPNLKENLVAEKCYCRLGGGCCPNGQDIDDNASDDQGHGTNVAGIVASTNNIYRGIAYNASLYIVKVFGDETGGSTLDIINAIDWCRNQSVNIISMSLGDQQNHPGDSICPDYYNTEINNAYNENITIVVASGNNGYNDGINYPACNSQVISVGATYDENLGWWYSLSHFVLYAPNCWDWTSSDIITCFTNKDSLLLDLLAPGAEITSTGLNGGISTMSGTSQATPHVAGAVALMLEKNTALTPNDIKTILRSSGKPIWDSETQTTYPRINIISAIESVPYCSCTSFSLGSCGGGDCLSSEKEYTRTCTPSGCDTESICVFTDSCSTGGGGGGSGGTVKELTVCASGCNYTTIQNAVVHSDINDKIYVMDNRTYAEEIVMNATTSGWLECKNESKISMSAYRGIFLNNVDGPVVYGCTISGYDIGIYLNSSHALIQNNTFINNGEAIHKE